LARLDASAPHPVHVTQEDVRRLCEFLYRRTGMSFPDDKRYYIDRRLAERIATTGSLSFQSYFAMLRADAEHEIEYLINAFTVNETYFYREEHQLRCMTSDLLGKMLSGKRAEEPIRIWSIPCSTGEEPYSIAIWLMENWGEVDKYNIEITGSDIDTRVLKSAAEGIYGTRALMRLPESLVARYFRLIGEGQYQIDAGLRDSVQFTRANLIDTQDMAVLPGFRHYFLPQRPHLF
jgi:chemotaxis protein methyltransferase CheR